MRTCVIRKRSQRRVLPKERHSVEGVCECVYLVKVNQIWRKIVVCIIIPSKLVVNYSLLEAL